MEWPNRTQQWGLILLLAGLVALATLRACSYAAESPLATTQSEPVGTLLAP